MLQDFQDFISPYSLERFRAEFQGRRPLHIPAAGDDRKRGLLDWPAFNALLGQSAIWTAQSLRLMINRVAVPPSDYCQPAQTPEGIVLRPSPPKVEVFLNSGASVVANEVQTLHPPIATAATALSRAFAAQVGANIYCSFKDIQAFGTHYDVHDVFAVQTEGEKLWRIYENQLEVPVELPPATDETRQWLEQSRGRLLQEVLMKPGDVLYLPRGRFHDALATEAASLHVTFSVTALYGRILFSLLDSAAMQFPLFRQSFPPADQDGGAALSAHLSRLGGFMSDLISSPAFRDEVAMAQERLVPRQTDFRLPLQSRFPVYRATGARFPDGSTADQIAYDWCVGRDRFSLDQMLSEFDFIEPGKLRRAIEAAEAGGAIARVD
jgi:hypothetical protein